MEELLPLWRHILPVPATTRNHQADQQLPETIQVFLTWGVGVPCSGFLPHLRDGL